MKLGFYDFIDNASRRGRPPRKRDVLGRLQCRRCRRWKDEHEYYAKDSRPYVHSYCKPCQIIKAQESYRRLKAQRPTPHVYVMPQGVVPVGAPGWGDCGRV